MSASDLMSMRGCTLTGQANLTLAVVTNSNGRVENSDSNGKNQRDKLFKGPRQEWVAPGSDAMLDT